MSMIFRRERDENGVGKAEGINCYECMFTTTKTNHGREYPASMRTIVLAREVEDAIAECRREWPKGFVLHQIVKRNQACDVIVAHSALSEAVMSVVDED